MSAREDKIDESVLETLKNSVGERLYPVDVQSFLDSEGLNCTLEEIEASLNRLGSKSNPEGTVEQWDDGSGENHYWFQEA
jgi:hypothetical protein